MYIHEAIQKAQSVSGGKIKEIALPNDEKCENNGYRLRLKPFQNNLQCFEFYGIQRKIDQFPLSVNEILRDDWFLVD